MKLFPLFADLQGRRVLVVGGGEVAARKVQVLLEASADVLVGAPQFIPELAELAAEGRIRLGVGAFQPEWLDDAWLAIAATDDRSVNAAVSAAAEATSSEYQRPAQLSQRPQGAAAGSSSWRERNSIRQPSVFS